MADEAQVRLSVVIVKNNLRYRNPKGDYLADLSGRKGPTPGAITVSRLGTTVSFSELTMPGLVVLTNTDETYNVEWGIWNPTQLEFYPLGELLPGEVAHFRFSRNLREEYSSPGTGTGTGALGSSEFRLKAEWAAGTTGAVVVVDAFEA